MKKYLKYKYSNFPNLNFKIILITSLIAQNVFANENRCLNLFSNLNGNNTLKIAAKSENIESKLINKLSASWELSRLGVGEMLSDLHDMDNVFYYALTALLSKENILIDGPGGGAKTLGIRKAFNAQLKAINSLKTSEEIELSKDISKFKIELIKIILNDRNQIDPEKKIFTQQFHATLSETKILGGPDPFKFIENGEYENDYSKAMISDQFIFGIIDEIEKGPVALQMTLLSILNERQALVGKKVVQTMLESVAATTNATLGELIAQALPHEVGGRKALIDRFALKVHAVNITSDANDLYLMLEKVQSSKKVKKYTIIDVRGLRPLLNKIKISDQLLQAMTEVTLQIDRFNSSKYNESQEEALINEQHSSFYPAFSGSTRTQSKVVKLWQSAFIVRQLMEGVPFESVRTTMEARDLIDLAPVLLHGGPDSIVPQFGHRIHFVQAISTDGFTVLGSNSKNKRKISFQLSDGYYDPNTQLFQYVSAKTGQLRRAKYDVNLKKIVSNDPDILSEINIDKNSLLIDIDNPLTQKYLDINKSLQLIEERKLKTANKVIPNKFVMTKKVETLLSSPDVAIRDASKQQILQIQEAHDEFLAVVNSQILNLKNQKMTFSNKNIYDSVEKFFIERAKRLNSLISKTIKLKDNSLMEDISALTVKNAFEELEYKFIDAKSSIKSIFLSMLNRKNVMLFGPPGSAKTLLSRSILVAQIEKLSEFQLAKEAQLLIHAVDELGSVAEKENSYKKSKNWKDAALWVKQFHPMSNEGDVVGRIDLKAVRAGQGYAYNRSGSLIAKEVLYAILDEFEKAPDGVKTALLSILNERELLDGDEVIKSNILAVVIATNSTPGQFITGLGSFSTGFPIFDRIHSKAYSFNKLSFKSLAEFHRRMYLGFDLNLKSPLMINTLTDLAKQYKLENHELKLLTEIHTAFMAEAVRKSEIERKLNLSDPSFDYYMNTRGETKRSAVSLFLEEFPGSVLLNKILDGVKPRQIREQGNTFDPKDLVAFAELYISFNGMYKIVHDYDANGLIYFKVHETELSSIMDRIDKHEKKTIEDMKEEFDLIARILNSKISKFIMDQKEVIISNPNLYPSLFVNSISRSKWNMSRK